MLSEYIEELVKTSKVQSKLDAHLEGLAKQAAAEVEVQTFLEHTTVEELAKIAGIELPEDICGGCGNAMEKLGSVFQCGCGLMKKAKVKTALKQRPTAAPMPTLKTAGVKSASIAKFAKVMKANNGDIDKALTQLEKEGYTKLAFGMAALKGLGTRALGAAKAAPGAIAGKARQVGSTYTMGAQGISRQGGKLVGGGQEGAVGGLKAVAQRHPGVAAGAAAIPVGAGAGYAMGKEGADYSVTPSGSAARKAMETVAKHPSGSKWMAHPELMGDIQNYQALHSLGGLGIGGGVGGLGGLLASALSKGKISPGAGAGYGALGGALLGSGVGGVHGAVKGQGEFFKKRGIEPYMMGFKARMTPEAAKQYLSKADLAEAQRMKTSSVLMEVGDAAGRIMAKTADWSNISGKPMLTPEEIREAIEGAQGREDIEGRGTAWGRTGAGLGALAGGGAGASTGYGIGRLLGARAPLAAGIGGLAGAGLGGVLGHRIGKAEGTEEAAADRLVSLLRARRAFGMGTGHGYMHGLTQGMGGDEGEAEAGPQ